MKFTLIYILARFRGLFPDKHRGNVFVSGLERADIKDIYEKNNWWPYWISGRKVDFIAPGSWKRM